MLDAVVADIRRGESRSLVLRGEAGVGKTALLEYLTASAPDLSVVRAVGVESEMELAYSGLHQLCGTMLDQLEKLPELQRLTLEVVFGLTAGVAPDPFLVGLATLGLLSEVSEERPLLCVVDDAQWLDQGSAMTLAFVARRLLAEHVGLVFAVREPNDVLRHLPVLEVGGLRNGDARALLSSAVRFKLVEQVRDRILAEARGNPLALLELPRGLSATELAGFGTGAMSTVPTGLDETFRRRIGVLPDETRRLLLIAAADPLGDAVLVRRAAELCGITAAAAAPAVEAGLCEFGVRIRFRHPLVRAAAYGVGSPDERRRAHAAIAEATDPAADPDRRAWHRALASAGPDEAVADELELSAVRARARGGEAATAAFLERAVTLTLDVSRRVERALAAAEANHLAGSGEDALRLAGAADRGPLDEFQRARVNLVRGHVAFASGFGSDAAPLLLKAARRLERVDPERARQAYLTAWGAATLAPGHLGEGGVLLEISRAILDLPRQPGAPRPLDLLLEGLALLTIDGRAAATPTLRRAAKVLADIPVEDVLHWGWMATAASNAIWDNDGTYAISARQVQLVRDAGALGQLPLYLHALGIARASTGDLEGAASNMAEADSAAAATGSASLPWTAVRLRALQGKEAEAVAAIATAIKQAAAGVHVLAIHAHWAGAVLYNGLGRYKEATASARKATSNAFEYWVSAFALPELVEAAARAEDTACARDALERLAETTQPAANDFALGTEARCQALLSEGPAADRLYREAIDRLGRTQLRPELARAYLLHGEWLRRENQRLDARVQLRTAYGMLSAIGMEAFAERARRELLATGETVRKRNVETRDDLTPQERQIAQLARDGLSNSEIGTRLFLSPRTVEWHLGKVFGKLGIGSRKELRSALSEVGAVITAA